jgi:hypothetical protein
MQKVGRVAWNLRTERMLKTDIVRNVRYLRIVTLDETNKAFVSLAEAIVLQFYRKTVPMEIKGNFQ